MPVSDQTVASLFFPNAQVSTAKMILFRTLAHSALKGNERISAAVFSYYSLLHLSITAMYLCPGKMDVDLREKLVAERKDGAVDPTDKISHDAVLQFFRNTGLCLGGVTIADLFNQARNMRELFNYGPRVTWGKNVILVGPCHIKPNGCDGIVSQLDAICKTVLAWVLVEQPTQLRLASMAIPFSGAMFTQGDLFYLEWCSDTTVKSCLSFLDELNAFLFTKAKP